VRLVVVDDHPVMRQALGVLVASWNRSVQVVGEASTARDAVAVVDAIAPDLVLMDLALPGPNGVVAIRELRRAKRRCRILVYSALRLPAVAVDALAAGADGYALKTDGEEELRLAIDLVSRGQRYVSPSLKEEIAATAAGPSGMARLSRREREVFDLVLDGHTNLTLAGQLFISIKTVETHRARINRKLGIHSTSDLLRFAAANGLISSWRSTQGPVPAARRRVIAQRSSGAARNGVPGATSTNDQN
jgi:DNA-binding NarL/FixJ family response regulator